MIKLSSSGSFNNTESFLRNIKEQYYMRKLDKAGQMGVEALAAATPKRSGKTASMWSYRIDNPGNGTYTITWCSDNINRNVNIAMIIQLGHGTKNGGYVAGIDYINPAMKPVFEKIEQEIWKEVTEA